MKRRSGYYWVLIEEDSPVYTIGEYNSKFDIWNFCGMDMNFKDHQIFEIDERQINHEGIEVIT